MPNLALLPDRDILRGFVVLEGIDGSGRTTQLDMLEKKLAMLNIPHWLTTEPTEEEEGILIRKVMADSPKRHPATLAYLFAADRNEHLEGKIGIKSHLLQGELVVSNRYFFSSLAYQGLTCSEAFIEALNANFPLPEYLIYFDITADSAFKRIKTREQLEIFETREFIGKVASRYSHILEKYSQYKMNIHKIRADLSPSETHDSIIKILEPLLSRYTHTI